MSIARRHRRLGPVVTLLVATGLALAALLTPVGGAGPLSATPRADAVQPAGGAFRCDPGGSGAGTFVANGPGGYVLGNCSATTPFTRSAKSDPTGNPARTFEGGMIGGAFNGCGWVPSNRSVQTDPNAGSGPEGCSHARPLGEFASLVNCAPGCPGDGTPVDTVQACPIFGNYRPWSDTPAPVEQLGTLGAAPGAFVWRYVTRDGQYVMGRVAGAPAESGSPNWGFIARGCLPAVLPAGDGGTYTP